MFAERLEVDVEHLILAILQELSSYSGSSVSMKEEKKNYHRKNKSVPSGPPRVQKHRFLTHIAKKKLAQGFFVLERVMRHHKESLLCTERSLYYRDPLLFTEGQAEVHQSIQRVCGWLNRIAYSSQKTTSIYGELCSSASTLSSSFKSPSQTFPQSAGFHTFLSHPDHIEEKIRCNPESSMGLYTRESLGIIANGKSVLVGYISFDVSEDKASPADTRTSPCWSLSGMAHGSQGWTITSDVVLRSSHFRGLFVSDKQCSTDFHSILPSSKRRLSEHPHVLVVVEKESVLQTLLETDHALDPQGTRKMQQHLIFLCTKGYPCVASRLFLRRLHEAWPTLPLLIFTDGDPHGLHIALSLMGIPVNSKFDAVDTNESLQYRQLQGVVPLQWIGIQPSMLTDMHASILSQNPNSTLLKKIPLQLCSSEDEKHLTRLQSTLETLLSSVASLSQNTPSPFTSCDPNALLHSLSIMLNEARWMMKSKTKCEIEALHPISPLSYLQQRFSQL